MDMDTNSDDAAQMTLIQVRTAGVSKAYVGSWGSAGVSPHRTWAVSPSMYSRTLMASDRSMCSLVTESPWGCS